ncbi:hypothetical protein [Haladaptatus cibarius]|uniref:hypothetical protein n=1 Tax=Haladaptatus cibarius TaxID=453847 RepID=UPI000B12E5FE|nr:hypothetical protein [Haladaptatus cibarius]
MKITPQLLKELLTVVTMLTTFINTMTEMAHITNTRLVIVVLLACLLGLTLLVRD